MSELFPPQFNIRGDMMPPSFGSTPQGDPIMTQTNNRGDVVVPNYGTGIHGDPIGILTNPNTGDVVITPTMPNNDVPDAIKARYASEQSTARPSSISDGEVLLGELTTASATEYLRERQARAASVHIALPEVIHLEVENVELKPKWTGYEDFKSFQQHGLVDLRREKDSVSGNPVLTDVVRTPQDAQDWRKRNITPSKLIELGYAYKVGSTVKYRDEEQAAEWRLEHASDDDRELHEHFLKVLKNLKSGPTEGNIWQSSRRASLED